MTGKSLEPLHQADLEGRLFKGPISLLFMDGAATFFADRVTLELKMEGIQIKGTSYVTTDEHPFNWPVESPESGYFSGIHYGSMGERIWGFQFIGDMPKPTDQLLIVANRYAVGTYFNALCRTLEMHAGRNFSPEADVQTVAFFREVSGFSYDELFGTNRGEVTARNVFIRLATDPERRWFNYVPIENGKILSSVAAVYSPVDEAPGSQK